MRLVLSCSLERRTSLWAGLSLATRPSPWCWTTCELTSDHNFRMAVGTALPTLESIHSHLREFGLDHDKWAELSVWEGR